MVYKMGSRDWLDRLLVLIEFTTRGILAMNWNEFVMKFHYLDEILAIISSQKNYMKEIRITLSQQWNRGY